MSAYREPAQQSERELGFWFGIDPYWFGYERVKAMIAADVSRRFGWRTRFEDGRIHLSGTGITWRDALAARDWIAARWPEACVGVDIRRDL